MITLNLGLFLIVALLVLYIVAWRFTPAGWLTHAMNAMSASSGTLAILAAFDWQPFIPAPYAVGLALVCNVLSSIARERKRGEAK